MARPACVSAMTRALGRQPTAAELKNIEERIRRNLRTLARQHPQQMGQMTTRQRLDAAAHQAARDLVIEAAKEKQRVALAIIARQRVDDYVRTHPGDNALDALDELIAFKASAKGRVMSLETRARAINRNAQRQLIDLWEQGGAKFLGLWQNKAGLADLMRELHGKDSGNAAAKKAATAWHKVAEDMRQAYNDAGGVIGKLDDWGMPHHHSQRLVSAAGRQKWTDDTLPMLNRSRYVKDDGTPMSDAELRDFLDAAYLSIATGGANKVEPGQFRGAGMRASRHAEERQIHFKDPDSFIAYQESYGDKGLYQVLIDHVRAMSRDQALIEVLGPNPDQTMKWAIDKAFQDSAIRTPEALTKLEERAREVERIYNAVSGKTDPIVNRRLARWANDMRSLLIASRLGSAIITSMSDEATMLTTARVNRIPYLQVFRNELAALNPANPTELALARRSGLALDTMIGVLNRFGQDDLTTPMGRVATATLRASGLLAITEARQRAFGVTMMDGIGKVTRSTKWADLNPDDHGMLLSKGVTEQDWRIWQAAKLEDYGNGNPGVLTPDAISAVDDAAIGGILGHGDPVAIRNARRDALTRLMGAVAEEVDMAVIVPGVRDQMLTTLNTPKGTVRGELVRSVFLFKSFPMAMIARHWGRAGQQNKRAVYLGSLIATTTVMGALSIQINEMMSGRDPRPMGDWRFWTAAMLKGGSLGLYGDFLFSQSSQYGSSPVASLAGPAMGLLEEAANLTQGNLIELAQGDPTRFGAELVKFIKGITPGQNIWYAKGALDHLIFQQLQEHFSPGYLARVKRRAKREFNQEYWWEPGKTTPRRGPDLERALER